MANLTETSRWEAGIYQFETSDPVMGGPNGIDNRPTRELANRTLWLKNEIAKAVSSIGANKTAADRELGLKAAAATTFSAGAGLTGGGTLGANRSFALATPSTLNGNTANWAGNGATGHTHELAKATATVAGVVKLANALDLSATDAALTAAMGKKLNEEKLGNSGSQTLNGTLTVNNTAWSKAEFPSTDGGKWRLEFNPKGDAEKSLNFNYVANGNRQTYIWFPKVTGNENVAYQSWVSDRIQSVSDGKINVKADNYERGETDYSRCGFYRANGSRLDGNQLPPMEIHIAHPAQSDNKYARGIGFQYGHHGWGVYTTAWDAAGAYRGMKTVLTEENGVMLSGTQDIGGTKTFIERADFRRGLRITKGSDWVELNAGASDVYLRNPASNKSLQLKDNGELHYSNQKIYHEGNKPAWADVWDKPDIATRGTTLQHYGITDAVGTADFNWAKVPSGTVAYFAGDTAPHGWLAANGAAVSRTGFAALFAAIGTRYGAGNGSTTFNVPDLRGEFVRGWDAGRGADRGRALGSGQEQSDRQHWHPVGHLRPGNDDALFIARDWGAGYVGAAREVDGELNREVAQQISGGNLGTGAAIEHTGETRPRNVALLACIKA